MSNIKGLAFQSIKNYLLKRYPENRIKDIKISLSDAEYRTLMNPNPKQFYPLQYYVNVNNSIVDHLGNGDISLLRKLGRNSADEAVRGIYRVFFQFGTPYFILKRAAVVFSKYYDNGVLAITEGGDRFVKLQLVGFNQMRNPSFKYICLTIEGWIERAVEICSGKDTKCYQQECISKGDDFCVFICEW